MTLGYISLLSAKGLYMFFKYGLKIKPECVKNQSIKFKTIVEYKFKEERSV